MNKGKACRGKSAGGYRAPGNMGATPLSRALPLDLDAEDLRTTRETSHPGLPAATPNPGPVVRTVRRKPAVVVELISCPCSNAGVSLRRRRTTDDTGGRAGGRTMNLRRRRNPCYNGRAGRLSQTHQATLAGRERLGTNLPATPARRRTWSNGPGYPPGKQGKCLRAWTAESLK